MDTIILNLETMELTDEQFYQLCQENQDLQLERTAKGELVIMPPVGGDRSPDVAWVKRERWKALTAEEREKFPPICPDFVIELRSKTDSLKLLREKMADYLHSGLRLGWLINPQEQEVEIYRQNQSREILKLPITLLGEDVLPGFILDLDNF